MAFKITPNVHVVRDKKGVIRHLRHLQEPYRPAEDLITPKPQKLAADYVHDVASIYEIDDELLVDINKPVEKEPIEEGARLRLVKEKKMLETTVVSYVQTHFGLPIWEAGVSVTLHSNPLRITSSTSSIHHDIKVEKPDLKSRFMPDSLTVADTTRLLKLTQRAPRIKINQKRLLIYRYDPDFRFHPESHDKERVKKKIVPLQEPPPTLTLPPVSKIIEPGRHYVVMEILFTYPIKGWGNVNWRAFIEINTGAVLYLRALVACAFGNVFEIDPVTSTGATVDPCGPTVDLDALSSVVTLLGLNPPANPGDPQELSGEFVEVQDLNAPNIDPPSAALPSGNFSFSAITDNFAAVNAYHHVDGLFRLVQDMGFTISDYFDGTGFPVPVDHRGKGGTVNAHCAGNTSSDGVGEFAFGLVESGCPVGMAAAVRVVMHEFGHALLWDSVHSPNFGFAHSAGDSLAAILCDPSTQAPDRFNSFPWVTTENPTISRRHDRDIASGWAWGGANDIGGYNSEQILSTTLFRIYRATGGDSTHPNTGIQLDRRRFAARYKAYLIVRGIGSLATAPVTPTLDPDIFATALMDADTGTVNFEGHPGGAFHKVIRWGFEKQGLYQPAGAPTPVTSEGDPPDVDVYIDDGRNGEYEFQSNFWNSQDIWNRLLSDGGLTHETPVTMQTNYMYVRIKNRGIQSANNAVVNAYHCRPATGLVWPDDWKPMTTAQLPAPGPIPSGGDVIMGPFEWTPEVVGHECLLAFVSADGDLSNLDLASGLPSATGPIQHWRVVPFDNNIGQRNVAPVAGGGGSLSLVKSFVKRRFWINNPYSRTVRIVLETKIPAFLQRRKWKLRFFNPGGGSFTLGPRASREVIMGLEEGGNFSTSDVEAAGKDTVIEVLSLVDNQLVGGMTYLIDSKLKEPPVEVPKAPKKPDCSDVAKDLLDCLKVPVDEVKSVRVKRITVDIDLEKDC